jgi:branched-chain amino acid transport system substrate-binding protein
MLVPLDHAGPPAARRAAAAAARLAPADRWQVALLLALTGPGALAGDAFRNGVEMAVQGINGAGGLLGRLVQTTTFNTASSPQGALATLHRALEGAPVALLGPVAPIETEAVAPFTRERRMLQIAASTENPPPPGDTLLLTSPAAAARMTMLANWLATDLRITRVALLATPAHGRLASLLAAACRIRQVQPVADLTLPHPAVPREEAADLPGLLARIQAAEPQALFIGAGGALAARIIRAARQLAPKLVLFGTADLLAPAVLEAAGDAALGLRGFTSLPPEAPIGPLEDFRASYLSQYHAEPDALAMQGYIALSMLQAAIQITAPAAPTGPALAAALRAATLRAALWPGILLDTSWDTAGQPHRAAFVAEVLPANGLGWSVVPPLQG